LVVSVFSLIGSAAPPALASRALRVRMNNCSEWSAGEVERLARLELATVGGGESDAGGADVEITCDEAGAALLASDSQTRHTLSRRIELSAGAEDAERVLAISAAQLVRALDWLPEPPARATVVKPRATQPQPPRSPPRRPLELQLGAGPRTRDAGAPFLTYRAALGGALEVGSGIALGGAFSYERGNAERSLGQVRTELVGAAMRAQLEPWRGNRWSCLWRVELEVNRLGLRGEESVAGVRTRQIRGMGGQVQLALGPVLRSAGVGIALLAQGGGSHFGGEGRVSDDDAVNLNGAWAGLELAMLWAP
jgi:hypothetical protein